MKHRELISLLALAASIAPGPAFAGPVPLDSPECIAARQAAVTARKIYDQDYEARNPGSQSISLSLEELDGCLASPKGMFVRKFGGQRWRFVPLENGSYITDPREIWVSDDPTVGEVWAWFSEWRSEEPTEAQAKELTSLFLAAR